MTATAETITKLLKDPFPADRVSWLPKKLASREDRYAALALAYIDARDVMARLDEVCGPANWQDEYTETPRGRVICNLRIKLGRDWIAKSDASGDSDIESEKGGISGAFKRAGVKWGIGRYLYDLDAPWAECTVNRGSGGTPEFADWTARGRAILNQALTGESADANSAATPPPPTEVAEFLRDLEREFREGNASAYWKQNFAQLPLSWRGLAEQREEALKLKFNSSACARPKQGSKQVSPANSRRGSKG